MNNNLVKMFNENGEIKIGNNVLYIQNKDNESFLVHGVSKSFNCMPNIIPNDPLDCYSIAYTLTVKIKHDDPEWILKLKNVKPFDAFDFAIVTKLEKNDKTLYTNEQIISRVTEYMTDIIAKAYNLKFDCTNDKFRMWLTFVPKNVFNPQDCEYGRFESIKTFCDVHKNMFLSITGKDCSYWCCIYALKDMVSKNKPKLGGYSGRLADDYSISIIGEHSNYGSKYRLNLYDLHDGSKDDDMVFNCTFENFDENATNTEIIKTCYNIVLVHLIESNVISEEKINEYKEIIRNLNV